jgi:hypothetical protein
MGCIYTAINPRVSKNGVFKIGYTKEKYPTKRMSANELDCIYYLSCPKATESELLMLESVARCSCVVLGMTQNAMDWFNYSVDRRYKSNKHQAQVFAERVMSDVIAECGRRNIEYTLKACFYNGKNYSCCAAKII